MITAKTLLFSGEKLVLKKTNDMFIQIHRDIFQPEVVDPADFFLEPRSKSKIFGSWLVNRGPHVRYPHEK